MAEPGARFVTCWSRDFRTPAATLLRGSRRSSSGQGSWRGLGACRAPALVPGPPLCPLFARARATPGTQEVPSRVAMRAGRAGCCWPWGPQPARGPGGPSPRELQLPGWCHWVLATELDTEICPECCAPRSEDLSLWPRRLCGDLQPWPRWQLRSHLSGAFRGGSRCGQRSSCWRW